MISFRKLEREDLLDLLTLKQESYLRTHHTTIANMEDQERWYASLDHHPHTPRQLYLIAENDRGMVGLLKFDPIDWANRTASMGWDVFAPFRGQGHGKVLVQQGVTYGFGVLNMHRLQAEILDGNIASEKCAFAAGFNLEGTRRSAVQKNGKRLDSHIYGILANEKTP